MENNATSGGLWLVPVSLTPPLSLGERQESGTGPKNKANSWVKELRRCKTPVKEDRAAVTSKETQVSGSSH